MALHEQLSIPSQRFKSGSLSMLPLPPNNNNNSFVPPISSIHGCSNERSMFMPLYNSHESSILADKFHSYSIPGTKLNTVKGNQERKFMKATEYNSLDTTPAKPEVSKSNSLQPLHFSNFKKFSSRKLGFDDELTVPTSVLPGIDQNCSCSQQSEGQESFPNLNLNSSVQLQIANEKKKKECDSIDSDSRRYVRNEGEENGRLLRSHQDLMERPNSTKCNSVDIFNSEDGPNAWLHNEYIVAQDDRIFRENVLVESGRCLENASKVGSESCSREAPGIDNGSSNVLVNKSKALEEKKCGIMQVRDISKHKNARGASLAESLSPLDICADDVVGIIGEKHFWEVRREIVNHQRVFAQQVFELHRLIKVQRLIAGSPHMLLEDTLHMAKSSFDVSSIYKSPSNYIPEPPLFLKDNSQKSNVSIKHVDDDAVAKLPLPSATDVTNEGLVSHRPKYVLYSGNPLSNPMVANTWPSPCCFSPTGNQWLVPIMSPSEGLLYKPYTSKPYTSPCPLTAGFSAPVYGNRRGFSNAPYGLSDSLQHGIGILPGNPPIGQSYFLHYGMPVSNPSIFGSAVKQMCSFNGVRSKGNQFSTSDVNFTIAHQSSCSMSSQMSQAISYCVGKLPALKENEIQGNKASSPSERAKGDALPLFPTKPTILATNPDAQTRASRGRVIKVVPHNPRLATESAARIFRSIQEERKQYG